MFSQRQIKNNFTRGNGIFENLLSNKRAKLADKKIPSELRSGKILDIGCGYFPNFLIKTNFNKKYGIDPSYKIKNSFDDIELIQMDIKKEEKLPFNDNFFDVITLLAVYEHIEPTRLNKTLSEILRVLKPGGRFILTTPAPWTDKLLRFMANLNLVSREEIYEHKDAYSHSRILNSLIKSGFPKKLVKQGYFEMFLNIWTHAGKQ